MFKNTAELGSFGEFVYLNFVRSKGMSIEKEGIFEHDFIINNQFLIDVKTTEKNKTKWSGRRINPDFIYDMITVHDGFVKIFPDLNSPLISFSGQILGKTNYLFDQWIDFKKQIKSNPIRRVSNKHTLNRDLIESQIISLFANNSLKRIRFIFRGSVSKTRWSSSPDNLPGSLKKINENDVTIFIQMFSNNHSESISKIFLILHDSLSDIKMKQGDKRQVNKGILSVVDLEWFAEHKCDFVFDGIEDLEIFVRNKNL
jgi:hypothetical protein